MILFSFKLLNGGDRISIDDVWNVILTEVFHFLVEQEAPPQYYNSRQTLVASSDVEQTHDTGHDNVNAQVSAMKEPTSFHTFMLL